MNTHPVPYIVTTTQRAIRVTATSPERAVRQVMDFECCPVRSILKVLPYEPPAKTKPTKERKPS